MKSDDEIQIIDELVSILRSNEKTLRRYKSTIEVLEHRKKVASSNTFRVGVLGVTSSGKSTLINALIGEDLLPSRVAPSSNTLVSCRRDSKRYCNITLSNGKLINVEGKALNKDFIAKYADEVINVKNHEHVEIIKLSSPELQLDERITLIDSPGLDAYGYEGHEDLTMNNLLPTVDFCIFVTTCKTNSDAKARWIIDTIAKYERPVIIVQNMIDSINPSPDGLKTAHMVAQEHLSRLENIIEQSNFKNKSNVKIVQMSAIWALEGREKGKEGLISRSKYKELIDAINETFSESVLPKVHEIRLRFLKSEIERLISEAKSDSKPQKIPITPFKYEGKVKELENSLTDSIAQICELFSDIETFEDEVQMEYSFDAYSVSTVKEKCSEKLKGISLIQQDFYETLKRLCDELGISTRNAIIPTIDTATPNLSVKRTIQTVNKPGLGNFLKRTFSGGRKGTETHMVIDNDRTRDAIYDYIDSICKKTSESLKTWHKFINTIIENIEKVIETKRQEHKERLIAIEKNDLTKIIESLQRLSLSIQLAEVPKSPINSKKTSIEETATKRIEVKQGTVSIYKASKAILCNIQRTTLNSILKFHGSQNAKNIVIGWDTDSIISFIERLSGCKLKTESLKLGVNDNAAANNLTIVHKPNTLTSSQTSKKEVCNYFILINAMQVGSALTQISKLNLKKAYCSTGVYFLYHSGFARDNQCR